MTDKCETCRFNPDNNNYYAGGDCATSKFRLHFYLSVFKSMLVIVIISWFIYSLFTMNYFGNNAILNLSYGFNQLARPDIYIYLYIPPIITTFFNIFYQKFTKIKYIVMTYPLVYIFSPFLLDNFYFIINSPNGNIEFIYLFFSTKDRIWLFNYLFNYLFQFYGVVEIQFIFLDFLTVGHYMFLTLIYLIIGLIFILKVENFRYFLLMCLFTVFIYCSLPIAFILRFLNYDVRFSYHIIEYIGFASIWALFFVILILKYWRDNPSWWDLEIGNPFKDICKEVQSKNSNSEEELRK